ncbi:MAG TPA: hypothetical protein VL654_06500 [Casimicrobiaceae bacterium]|nr:hypothetical protein [Casimicrobiaceae bacterium]
MNVMDRRQGRPRALRGMYLLEALVALVVLSLGLFGLLGLLAGALRGSAGATWRSDGFGIAADALARISTEAPATIADRYDASADGAGYRALLAQALRLPGVSSDANAPDVSVDDAGESRSVRVVVRWQPPNESMHQASLHVALPRP